MGKRQSEKTRQRQADERPEIRLGESPVLRVTLPFLAAFVGVSFFSRIRSSPSLWEYYLGAAGILAVWLVVLLWRSVETRRMLVVEFIPRRSHYVQACVQGFIFFYWGWYWRQVYDSAPLIISQLLFAYAFDSLLCWSRREKWVLGFGPFPIIFSLNIFLWFKDDWFYLQFVMIAVGFLAKEFIRWQRDGKSTHIFNPSAFSLGLFAILLVATRSSDLTVGQQIASTLFMPPKIYVVLFLLGLLAMYFFSTTLIAACAAITLFGLSAVYLKMTGVYWFLDSDIPIAVFLGLHLLVTDPATSPRTLPGKAIFGTIYGILVFTSYGFLASLGVPTFYDKLLPIPLLNLMVPLIDRFVSSTSFERLASRSPLNAVAPRTLNLAFMSVWIVFFITMNQTGHADDAHPGKRVPFWQQACAEGRVNACRNLVTVEDAYCTSGSAWACSELGANLLEGKVVARDTDRAARLIAFACQSGRAEACTNSMFAIGGMAGAAGFELLRGDPAAEDYKILLRGGKAPFAPMSQEELFGMACQQGWETACQEKAL